MSPRIVLGLDPGTARTGYGVVKRDGSRVTMLGCGLLETAADDEPQKRLLSLRNQLDNLLASEKPDEVAVEKLFFTTNTKTAMAVSEARGVILQVIAAAGRPLSEYTPLQIKQSVAGYGRADKRQVAAMVCRQLDLPKAPKPDDVTDALAIAVCHAFWRQS